MTWCRDVASPCSGSAVTRKPRPEGSHAMLSYDRHPGMRHLFRAPLPTGRTMMCPADSAAIFVPSGDQLYRGLNGSVVGCVVMTRSPVPSTLAMIKDECSGDC